MDTTKTALSGHIPSLTPGLTTTNDISERRQHNIDAVILSIS